MRTPNDEKADQTNQSRQLLQETLHGNPLALDQLLQRHLPQLRVFVRLQVGDFLRQQESCSDLVQSVCRELLEGLDHFDYQGEDKFRNWLYVAALNKIRQHDRYFRADKRDPARELRLDTGAQDVAMEKAYATAFTPSRQAMAREDIERLEAAFDALPEHYRQVITLSRIVGLSQKQVAQQMGRSVPSVRAAIPHSTGPTMLCQSAAQQRHVAVNRHFELSRRLRHAGEKQALFFDSDRVQQDHASQP